MRSHDSRAQTAPRSPPTSSGSRSAGVIVADRNAVNETATVAAIARRGHARIRAAAIRGSRGGLRAVASALIARRARVSLQSRHGSRETGRSRPRGRCLSHGLAPEPEGRAPRAVRRRGPRGGRATRGRGGPVLPGRRHRPGRPARQGPSRHRPGNTAPAIGDGGPGHARASDATARQPPCRRSSVKQRRPAARRPTSTECETRSGSRRTIAHSTYRTPNQKPSPLLHAGLARRAGRAARAAALGRGHRGADRRVA